jgi:hypothetical protein
MEGRHMAAINKEKASMILGRIVAVFAASGLSVIGAGAIAGVELSQAVLMAGIGGVATVIEGLSRAYLQDGKLSAAEIDEVFNAVDKKNSARKASASSK